MTVLINVDVPDLETAIVFYTTAFGLAAGRRFGSEPSRQQQPRSPQASIAATRGPPSNKRSAATRHSPPKVAAWHGSINARGARNSGRSSRSECLARRP